MDDGRVRCGGTSDRQKGKKISSFSWKNAHAHDTKFIVVHETYFGDLSGRQYKMAN